MFDLVFVSIKYIYEVSSSFFHTYISIWSSPPIIKLMMSIWRVPSANQIVTYKGDFIFSYAFFQVTRTLALSFTIILLMKIQDATRINELLNKIYHRFWFCFVFKSCERSLLSYSRSSNLQNDWHCQMVKNSVILYKKFFFLSPHFLLFFVPDSVRWCFPSLHLYKPFFFFEAEKWKSLLSLPLSLSLSLLSCSRSLLCLALIIYVCSRHIYKVTWTQTTTTYHVVLFSIKIYACYRS
jgi:hypothetical protein